MRYDLIRTTVSPAIEKRLWDKVDQSDGADACWPFTGAVDGFGYGIVFVDGGKKAFAHRLAYVIANDCDIEAGLVIRHLCHHPYCCNPKHLRVGTHRENADDREERRQGRSYRRSVFSPRADPHEHADFVAFLYNGGMSVRDIAELLAVGKSVISRVLESQNVQMRTYGGWRQPKRHR